MRDGIVKGQRSERSKPVFEGLMTFTLVLWLWTVQSMSVWTSHARAQSLRIFRNCTPRPSRGMKLIRAVVQQGPVKEAIPLHSLERISRLGILSRRPTPGRQKL
ncbi:hypothetical protein PGT21_013425 [Puccinia graminis f. sp. tritici]|uniref:Uncharacterized protein n=1 Tax=Puccinia graminis f. sp. tritici TaxID=56615 RepID=A0A5B0MH88_PUCGR|nr:hypothetical protein PGT21_013425 [Puccinia graminis f. sp. tritici]